VRDAAELLAERQEARYTAMVRAGTHTPAEIDALRKQQRHREEVHVCRLLIRSRVWETDCSCSARATYLCLAAALAGLNRRQDAIHTLQQALGSLPHQRQYLREAEAGAKVAEEEAPLGAAGADVAGPLSLALAKLLFQAGRKAEAFELTTKVLSRYTGCGGCRASAAIDAAAITAEEAAEAYQLGGWIQIHSDDHTSAYDIWSRGHHALPSCPFLARQAGKRACWDHGGGGGGDGTGASSGAGRRRLLLLRDAELACGLVGDGAHGSGTFDRGADLEAFAVPAGRPASALALFEAVREPRRSSSPPHPPLSCSLSAPAEPSADLH
jgi:tetratricopeptide (TPR) repeat protein